MIFKLRCSGVRKLLPLYVAGDLQSNARRAHFVALHLRACAECTRRAAEFEESRKMIRATASIPSFDRAFFDEIRSSVQAQIETQETLIPPLAGISRRRFAYAAAVATVLLVACSSVVFMRFNRTADDSSASGFVSFRQDAINSNESPKILHRQHSVTVVRRENYLPRGASFPSGVRPILAANRNTLPAHERLAQQPQLTTAAPPPQTQLAVLTPQVENITGENELLSDNSAPQRLVQASPTDAGQTDEHVLRIEFQTADPTIRIIWLAPRVDDTQTVAPMN
jgi:hypothetical protein